MSNANFFVKRQNIDLIKNLFANPFSEKKISIRKSKFFFNDKKNNIVFIYSINDLIFFKDPKENNKVLKTNGNIFKIPVKFEWIKNLDNKNTSSTFKASKIDIDFTNKGNLLNGNYIFEKNLNILSNNFKIQYQRKYPSSITAYMGSRIGDSCPAIQQCWTRGCSAASHIHWTCCANSTSYDSS